MKSKRVKTRHQQKPEPDLFQQLEQEGLRRDAERAALRRMEITGGDETELGCKSSGWTEYRERLLIKLHDLARNGITQADQAARILNNTGFKTGSGRPWTPRLINVAKFKLFGLMSDRVIG
jgi:hypothetical protein